ncbi:hypothetical protein BCR44DRAFT_1407050 [Catenaria anguillulae PL171]|uniref:Band 7 domain-containing protein n=1 Tax=Catenaria anguillulae PL171 TaxID=765915 RepID=A0A1Y2H5J2_9FUNG|nr:hypothetical protein BCR44DRAFT_1407050 [Catenaria anguillulae PL171]
MTAPRRQAKFAQEIAVTRATHGLYEGLMTVLGECLGFMGSFPCTPCSNPYRIVDQSTVGLISRFGKCQKMVDPGLHRINIMTDVIQSVDIKLQVVPIPAQAVMTKDNANIMVESVLYWRVVDPYIATFLTSNVQAALVERTQTTLRTIIGVRTLQECIELRETIMHEVQNIISGPAREWGTEVESILIKDLRLPAELMDSLSAAAKQRRLGESKVIAAEAEVQAAQLMRKASDVLNSSAALQVRYLETVKTMAAQAQQKVIFVPLGNDAASSLMQKVKVAGLPDVRGGRH